MRYFKLVQNSDLEYEFWIEWICMIINRVGVSRPLPVVSSINDAMRSARRLQRCFKLMGATGRTTSGASVWTIGGTTVPFSFSWYILPLYVTNYIPFKYIRNIFTV